MFTTSFPFGFDLRKLYYYAVASAVPYRFDDRRKRFRSMFSVHMACHEERRPGMLEDQLSIETDTSESNSITGARAGEGS
jgi:hypothetical protein